LAALGLLGVAALLAAGVGRAWANLDLPAPRIGAVEVGPAPTVERARVLLVVIDGLRADVAEKLPFLGELRAAGAHAQLWADPPTYSAAQYVALLTGVPPVDSGVRSNETLRPAGVDDVARRARAAGLRTAVISTCVDWWGRLFPESFDDARVVAEAELLAEAARLGSSPVFLVVHVCPVDDAGHAAGARSPQYAAAAVEADGLAAALALAPAWAGANVVVTSDHGHRDHGGHGGDEPEVRASFLVAAGPGVARGARVADARSVDMAPTLAAWLAVPSPAAAVGRTLVELLSAPPAAARALAAADRQRWARVGAARVPDPPPSLPWQLARAAGVLVALAALAACARRHPRALARGALVSAVIFAAFWLSFGAPSFSAARRGGLWVYALATIAFVATTLVLAWGARRGQPAAAVLATLAIPVFPALITVAREGLFAPRVACAPAWLAVGPAFAYTVAAAACAAAAVPMWLSSDEPPTRSVSG
jgi:hypothetical protein